MGTKFSGTAAERRTLDAYIKLRRAVNSIAGRTNVLMREAGLTESQFGVLEALHHLGPLCQKDIAAKVLKSAGNLTTVIDNLERRGLVRRERSREDRRVVMVHITDEGDGLVISVFPGHVEALVGGLRRAFGRRAGATGGALPEAGGSGRGASEHKGRTGIVAPPRRKRRPLRRHVSAEPLAKTEEPFIARAVLGPKTHKIAGGDARATRIRPFVARASPPAIIRRWLLQEAQLSRCAGGGGCTS